MSQPSKYEPIVTAHWSRWLPQAWKQITDQQTFARQQAEQIEAEVQTMAAAIAGPDRQNEDYLEKAARLMSARRDAESDVLRQMLPAPEEHLEAIDAETAQAEQIWQEQVRQVRIDSLRTEAEAIAALQEHPTEQIEAEAAEQIFRSLLAQAG